MSLRPGPGHEAHDSSAVIWVKEGGAICASLSVSLDLPPLPTAHVSLRLLRRKDPAHRLLSPVGEGPGERSISSFFWSLGCGRMESRGGVNAQGHGT